MADINRIRCAWAGVPGGGLSTFYLQGTPTSLAPLKTFFSAIAALVPSVVTVDIPNSGDVIESTTGALTGGWTATGGGAQAMSGTGNYSALSGAYIRWQTPTVVNGRRLVGRTFIVPLTAGQYDSNGTLGAGAVTTLQNAADALVLAFPGMGVWHRPGDDPGSGIIAGWSSAKVPDRVTVLRSRRD